MRILNYWKHDSFDSLWNISMLEPRHEQEFQLLETPCYHYWQAADKDT